MNFEALHPDLHVPWVKEILSDPTIEWQDEVPTKYRGNTVTNSMFERTLYTNHGIRAHISFKRPTKEPDAIFKMEGCYLISIGDGLDGKRGRAHGGFDSLILDQISGSASHHTWDHPIPPATATITVDFKAPVSTPCLVLARAWVIEIDRRKIWVKATLEDGMGVIFATAKSLFVASRPSAL